MVFSRLSAQSITSYYLVPEEPAPGQPAMLILQTFIPWGPCETPQWYLTVAPDNILDLYLYYTVGPLDPLLTCTDTLFLQGFDAGFHSLNLHTFQLLGDDTLAQPGIYSLDFNVIGPYYTIPENPFSLGTSCLGGTTGSAYRSIEIINSGNAPLEITDITGIMPPFVLESALPLLIEPGENGWIAFIFNNTLQNLPYGIYTDTIQIISNAWPPATSLVLSGEAAYCSGLPLEEDDKPYSLAYLPGAIILTCHNAHLYPRYKLSDINGRLLREGKIDSENILIDTRPYKGIAIFLFITDDNFLSSKIPLFN